MVCVFPCTKLQKIFFARAYYIEEWEHEYVNYVLCCKAEVTKCEKDGHALSVPVGECRYFFLLLCFDELLLLSCFF